HSFRLATPAVARKALPERKALRALIRAGGKMSVPKLQAASKFDDGELAVALGWLRRKGWAEVAKGPEGSVVSVTPEGREAAGSKGPDELLLARLAKGELPEDAIDPHVLRDLKSRRELVKERESVRREIALTPAGERILAAGLTLKEDVAQPTTELLRSGRWRQVDFRRYDTKAFAPLVRPGKRHVLGAYIERIRRIFLSMGFTEIDGDFVQSAFWNFDALFQPQELPARRHGLETLAGIPPDRRRGDGRGREPRPVDRHDRGVLPAARLHPREVPARLLSLHGAEHGAGRPDLRRPLDGARRERHLPAGGDGPPRDRFAGPGLGPRPRETRHDDRGALRHSAAVPERPRLVAGPPRDPVARP